MNPRELARIYDTYARRLYAYLLTLVRNRTDARDLLQDLFVKIARTRGCLDGVRDEKAFLFRIAHNLSVDFIRRAQSRRDRHGAVAELQSPSLIRRIPTPASSQIRFPGRSRDSRKSSAPPSISNSGRVSPLKRSATPSTSPRTPPPAGTVTGSTNYATRCVLSTKNCETRRRQK